MGDHFFLFGRGIDFYLIFAVFISFFKDIDFFLILSDRFFFLFIFSGCFFPREIIWAFSKSCNFFFRIIHNDLTIVRVIHFRWCIFIRMMLSHLYFLLNLTLNGKYFLIGPFKLLCFFRLTFIFIIIFYVFLCFHWNGIVRVKIKKLVNFLVWDAHQILLKAFDLGLLWIIVLFLAQEINGEASSIIELLMDSESIIIHKYALNPLNGFILLLDFRPPHLIFVKVVFLLITEVFYVFQNHQPSTLYFFQILRKNHTLQLEIKTRILYL